MAKLLSLIEAAIWGYVEIVRLFAYLLELTKEKVNSYGYSLDMGRW